MSLSKLYCSIRRTSVGLGTGSGTLPYYPPCAPRIIKAKRRNFSDEVLYNAKLHPEQYSDTFSSAQIKKLHTSIHYICGTAVSLLGDSSKFPDEWLFKHRWGKGKKDSPKTLPSGAKITHITVGGRTSCVVPSVQKKTGDVAADVKDEDLDQSEKASGTKANVSRKRKEVAKEEDESEPGEALGNGVKKARAAPKAKNNKVKKEEVDKSVVEEPAKRNSKQPKPVAKAKAGKVKSEEVPSGSRRRSTRVSK